MDRFITSQPRRTRSSTSTKHNSSTSPTTNTTNHETPDSMNMTQEVRWVDDDDHKSSTNLTTLFQSPNRSSTSSPSHSSSSSSSPSSPETVAGGRASKCATTIDTTPIRGTNGTTTNPTDDFDVTKESPLLATQPSSSPISPPSSPKRTDDGAPPESSPSASNPNNTTTVSTARKNDVEEEVNGIFAILEQEHVGDATSSARNSMGVVGSRRRRRRRDALQKQQQQELRTKQAGVGIGITAITRSRRGGTALDDGKRKRRSSTTITNRNIRTGRSTGRIDWRRRSRLSVGGGGVATDATAMGEEDGGVVVPVKGDESETVVNTGESYFETLLQELDEHTVVRRREDDEIMEGGATDSTHDSSTGDGVGSGSIEEKDKDDDLDVDGSLTPSQTNRGSDTSAVRETRTTLPPQPQHNGVSTDVSSNEKMGVNRPINIYKYKSNRDIGANLTTTATTSKTTTPPPPIDNTSIRPQNTSSIHNANANANANPNISKYKSNHDTGTNLPITTITSKTTITPPTINNTSIRPQNTSSIHNADPNSNISKYKSNHDTGINLPTSTITSKTTIPSPTINNTYLRPQDTSSIHNANPNISKYKYNHDTGANLPTTTITSKTTTPPPTINNTSIQQQDTSSIHNTDTTNNTNINKNDAISDDFFDGIDFNDDMFAAVDAAVNARLTMQSSTHDIITPPSSSRKDVDVGSPMEEVGTGTGTAAVCAQSHQQSKHQQQSHSQRHSRTGSIQLPMHHRGNTNMSPIHDHSKSHPSEDITHQRRSLHRATTLQTSNTSPSKLSRSGSPVSSHKPSISSSTREIICLDDDDDLKNTRSKTTPLETKHPSSSWNNQQNQKRNRTDAYSKPPPPHRPPKPSIVTNLHLPPLDTTASMTMANHTTDATTTTSTIIEPNNDEYDDLPMLDFDEIDRLIAQRNTTTTNHTSTTAHHQQQQSQLSQQRPKVVTPPNNRDGTNNDSPEMLSFTRYRIRTVVENVNAFTKTIGVSVWTLSDIDAGSDNGDGSDDDGNDDDTNGVGRNNNNNNTQAIDGEIHLHGEWFHSKCHTNDTIHICSIHGHHRTDASALPIHLHTLHDMGDDLVMVVHPDILVTPTSISETVSCTRRAALKIRLGSSGLTSRAALFGVMRHELFERCLLHNNFTRPFVQKHVPNIVRNHAESMIGCGLYHEREAIPEVVRVLPQIQQFAARYLKMNDNGSSHGGSGSKLDGHGISPSITMVARSVYATEDAATSPELGLKGFIDVTVEVEAIEPTTIISLQQQRQHQQQVPRRSLMGLELKTGHNQTPQNAHMAQLSLYTLMLKARHGSIVRTSTTNKKSNDTDNPPSHMPHHTYNTSTATKVVPGTNGSASGGMLLYLNDKSINAVHVCPTPNELKSLVNQRNVVATEIQRAAKPRGIRIEYERDDNGDGNGDDGTTTKKKKKKKKRITILPAPPAPLPELLSSSHSCQRCYSNRECMLNNAAATTITTTENNNNSNSNQQLSPSHRSNKNNKNKNPHTDLLHHFTGHLNHIELQYFRDWDRLIDLEAHVGLKHEITNAWLLPSNKRETMTGRCISSLVLVTTTGDDGHAETNGQSTISESVQQLGDNGDGEFAHTITFRRSDDSTLKTPLNTLKFEMGNRLILSTDGTSINPTIHNEQDWFDCSTSTTPSSSRAGRKRRKRHRMNVLKGVLKRIDERDISIGISAGDWKQLLHLIHSYRERYEDGNQPLSTTTAKETENLYFRLDKEEFTGGAKVLRQNLLNLFTSDILPYSPPTNQKYSQTTTTATQEKLSDMQLKLKHRMPWLRQSIIHFEAPRFNTNLAQPLFSSSDSRGAGTIHPIDGCQLSDLSKEFSQLNKDQKAAVIKIISAKDYSLIQGFPGTGKTSVICFVVRLLAARGKRVLVSSYTHGAVDNILIKLMQRGFGKRQKGGGVNADLVRIGRKSACHPNVHGILAPQIACSLYPTPDTDGDNDPKPSTESLRRVLSTAKIVGVSALTIPRSPLLVGQHFDYVIVDEAGQISQPAIIGALMAADSFVLVGDHEQLPPLVQSTSAEEAGYGVSMLKRLAEKHPAAIAQLTLQYRMNDDICSVCNEVVYKGKLKSANHVVSSSKIKLPKYPGALHTLRCHPSLGLGWLVPVLNPARSVVFVNTDTIGSNSLSGSFQGLEVSHRTGGDGGGVINDVEIGITRVIVQGLEACGLKPSATGVICPYRSQIKRLDEDPTLNRSKKLGLEISTIDRYQGRDKDAIILSLVRSNTQGKAGRLLEDYRRLNVALSRAKHKLIIIGSFCTLSNGSSVLGPILAGMKAKGWIETLPQNALSLYVAAA